MILLENLTERCFVLEAMIIAIWIVFGLLVAVVFLRGWFAEVGIVFGMGTPSQRQIDDRIAALSIRSAGLRDQEAETARKAAELLARAERVATWQRLR